jgi:hypothetical protein
MVFTPIDAKAPARILAARRCGRPGGAAVTSINELPIDIPVSAALASKIMLGAALLLAWTTFTPPVPAPLPSATAEDVAEWRGRAVCVDATGGRTECAAEGNRFALETSSGLRWFAAGDVLAPVFDDARVRAQDVVVKVRPRPDTTADLIKVYSAKHGKLHDVRYFCEVCNVTAFVPGLCPCCRAEMELVETPVE